MCTDRGVDPGVGGDIRNDRYFLSPRIVVRKEILAMLRPEPEPRRHYAITSRRARGGIGDGGEANCPIAGAIAYPIE
jgi:hypothetical protein